MNTANTSAITDPVQTGNHPMKTKKMMLKNWKTGITITDPNFPRIAITITRVIPIMQIREEIIPACVVVVFRKSATL